MDAAPQLSVIEQAVLARVRQLAPPAGARVLDVPCGTGALVSALDSAGFDAYGTDVVQVAAARLGQKFRRADLGGGIPAADAHYDLVVSVEGIEHMENPYGFVRELHRVLKPGGTCIVTTPNVVSLRSRMRFFGSGFYHQDPRPLNESSRHPLHHISLATFAELRYALHTAGFAIVDVSHTHIKPISCLYAVFYPWIAVYTMMAFRKEKDAAQRARNKEISRTLLAPSLLFGENVMIVAQRKR
jgi:2-polyprenyl-3-methyl-5-hydroxy-6-metoxy-1,4-benzoquinol methylase